MTQNDGALNKKKLIASFDDHDVRSIVSAPHTNINAISPDLATSLRPNFVKKSKTYTILLSGFPLLRKEPYTKKTALHKTIDQSDKVVANHTPLYAKPPPIQRKSQLNKKADLLLLISSLVLLGLIVALLILVAYFISLTHTPTGNSNQQQQPVDVVFTPDQTGSSGMTGEGLNAEEEQSPSPPPPPPAALPDFSPPPTPEENVGVSEPKAEPLPEDIGTIPLPIPKQEAKPQKKQPTKDHQYTYHYTPRPQQRRQQPAPKSSNNPFENMQSLDFSENPSKSRRKAATHKPRQGSRSAIDMSTGPLVQNGRINVPYAAKINIKGVNDEYGDAINAWIRQHLYYPPEAAKNGDDGSASVHVALNRDGYVLSVSLTNSSGSDILDSAITGMFRGARMPKIPPDLPDHFELDLTINYILLRR